MIRPLPLPLGWCLRTSIALEKFCKIWDACPSHVTSNCNLSEVERIYETLIKREVFKTCPLQTGPHPTSIPFLLRFFTPTERISRGSLGVVWNSSWDPPMKKIKCVCPYSNINMYINIWIIYIYINICYPPKIYLFWNLCYFCFCRKYWKINEKRSSGHGTDEKRTRVSASTRVKQCCRERYVRGLTWRGLIWYAGVRVPAWN